MESSQKFMILSLLNLYCSYININTKKESRPQKRPVNNRFAMRKLPVRQIMSKMHQDQAGAVSQRGVTTNFITSDTSTTVMKNQQEDKSLDNCSSVANRELMPGTSANCVIDKTELIEGDDEEIRGENIEILKEVIQEDSNRKPRKRRWAVRPINRDRAITGYHRKVFTNVKQMDQQKFFEHTRMSKSLFDWLLTFIQSSLKKSKQLIFPEERLAITLHYLAYGTSIQSIAFKHKIGKSTARQIVLTTCSVLWDLLAPIYLSEPTTSQYADIAEDFKNNWKIPNCVGAITGKHVSIRGPVKNNKDELSLLVLGVCDTKYKFTAVSVGKSGIQSDYGIFQTCSSNTVEVSNKLPLPSNKPLYPLSPPFPHYFISDTSFPLRKNIMRPYTESELDEIKTIYNYKISRARIITENTFGILTARFRVLLTTIEFLPKNCKTIILACIALHNFIMTNDEEQLYCPANFVDREIESGIIEEGEWRNEIKNNGDEPLPTMTTSDTRSTFEANKIRDTLANYFAGEAISYEIEIFEPN